MFPACPRNYELVLRGPFNGVQPFLTKQFEALGPQSGADELTGLAAKKASPISIRTRLVEGAHDKISGELDGKCCALLKRGTSSMESYSKAARRSLTSHLGTRAIGKRRDPQTT